MDTFLMLINGEWVDSESRKVYRCDRSGDRGNICSRAQRNVRLKSTRRFKRPKEPFQTGGGFPRNSAACSCGAPAPFWMDARRKSEDS